MYFQDTKKYFVNSEYSHHNEFERRGISFAHNDQVNYMNISVLDSNNGTEIRCRETVFPNTIFSDVAILYVAGK